MTNPARFPLWRSAGSEAFYGMRLWVEEKIYCCDLGEADFGGLESFPKLEEGFSHFLLRTESR